MPLVPFLLAAAPAPAVDASPAAARRVVEGYYAALQRRDYRTAWLAWDRGGQASGQSLAAFRRGFARTAATQVRAGAPFDQEGAAGSVYITVPVVVTARLADGTRQRFAGHYVLRRINDVDGSTREQRRWHLDSAKLAPAR